MKRLSRVTNIHDILLSATQNISFSHVFSSPKGYAIVHSLLSVTACFKRPSGTQIIFMANPALNRRATIARPSGTKCKPTSKCPNSRPLAGRDSCRPIQRQYCLTVGDRSVALSSDQLWRDSGAVSERCPVAEMLILVTEIVAGGQLSVVSEAFAPLILKLSSSTWSFARLRPLP